MQDQLKTIREACIKANPSILDLVPGCEFFFDTENSVGGKYIVTEIENRDSGDNQIHAWGYRNTEAGWFHQSDFSKLKNIEIIGRKIGIADVLAAIGKTKKYFGIMDDGKLIQATPSVDTYARHLIIEARWNLLNDDITHQSPECVAFIHELLK